MKRIILMMTMVLILFGFAAGSAQADIPTAVFINVPSDSADLQIRKSVISSVSGHSADPDTLFHFHITRDGVPFRNQEFTVTDADGDDVTLYDSAYPSVRIPHTTDHNGDFVLKAGWTARFRYFGSGASYEVGELELPEGYQQVQPAAGTKLSGTVGPKGTLLQFVNAFNPDTNPEYSRLTITKKLVFPPGYVIPDTADYMFEIHLDDELHKKLSFTVKDEQSVFLRMDQTDSEGIFKLKAGETAVFDEIPAGTAYAIRELNVSEKQVLGGTEREGTVKGRSTDITFTNCFASFAVTKELTGQESSEETFVFVLGQPDGVPLNDTEYYLYEDPAVQPELLQTDENGEFGLRVGQTALFAGIAANVTYCIREKYQEGWRTVLPSDKDGYTGKTKTDTAEVIRFVNAPLPEQRSLYVTKLITGAQADAEDTFICVLEKAVNNVEISQEEDSAAEETLYEAVCSAHFMIQSEAEPLEYLTDPHDGTFTLHAGETACFENLEPGKYRVREIEMPDCYSLRHENSTMEGVLDKNLYLTVTNEHTYHRTGSIRIRKKDGSGQVLNGARFVLTRQDDGSIVGEQVTKRDGTALFNELEPAIYVLTEVETKAGSALLSEPVIIALPLSMTEDEVLETGADTANAVHDSERHRWYFYDLKFEISNHAEFQMPMAGAGSERWIILAGFFCLGAAGILMKKRKKVV